jgi:hypothetical protein
LNKLLFIIIIILIYAETSNAQTNLGQGKGYLVYSSVSNGDTIPLIYLREITIIPDFVFTNKKEVVKYDKLVRNIKKVLPYAKIANTKLYVINENLKKMKTEAERKTYLKNEEKILRSEFSEDLKNLTISQGKLLIKLIDRETGNTTYELIKELKGTFTAFIYQSIAVFFGSTLKYEYDSKGEDKMIEDIIVRIENGQL